jgi:hypothetical protein
VLATANFRELRQCEVRRISIPRTTVNKPSKRSVDEGFIADSSLSLQCEQNEQGSCGERKLKMTNRRFLENRVVWFGLSILIYAVVGFVLWAVLHFVYIQPWQVAGDAKEATAKKELIQALALILAGGVGAIGIYFTWRQQRLTRRGLDDTRQGLDNTHESTLEQLQLTREGQIAERFTSAIDQLGAKDDKGNPQREIRLGGIYALERIASDYPKDYYSTVMKVLAAYVRENASLEQDAKATRPTTDIQAILEVFERRKEEPGLKKEDRVKLDLRRTNLRGAHLRGDLRGVRLYRAELQGARLQEANLQNADLQSANLEGANFEEANLEGATLIDAKLHGAEGLTTKQLRWTYGDHTTEVSIERPDIWKESPEKQKEIIEEHLKKRTKVSST